MERSQLTANWAPLGIGLLFIVIGVAFLLDDMGFLGDVPFWKLLPPFILMTLGITRLLQPGDGFVARGPTPKHDGLRAVRHGYRGGAWLLFVGALLLAHNLDVLRFNKSWPLFLVAIGAGTIVRALAGPREGVHGR